MFVKFNVIDYAQLMRIILFPFLVFFVCCLSAETVYKTVDADGNIIFTDTPSKNAEEINIQDIQTIKNPNAGAALPERRLLGDNDKKPAYKSVVVTNPKDGAGIRSNNGDISISISLKPALLPGHKIIISMDGEEVGTGNSVSLQNVDRGTHDIKVTVVDQSGEELISTSSTFSLLRVG